MYIIQILNAEPQKHNIFTTESKVKQKIWHQRSCICLRPTDAPYGGTQIITYSTLSYSPTAVNVHVPKLANNRTILAMTTKTGATRTYSNALLSIVVLLIQWDSKRWIPAQLTPQSNSDTGSSPTFIRTVSKTNQQRAISQLGTNILHWTTPTSCSQNPT